MKFARCPRVAKPVVAEGAVGEEGACRWAMVPNEVSGVRGTVHVQSVHRPSSIARRAPSGASKEDKTIDMLLSRGTPEVDETIDMLLLLQDVWNSQQSTNIFIQ